MSALVRAGAKSAAPRILAARHALPPLSAAVAKARHTATEGGGGGGRAGGGGGGASSSSSSSPPLDLDALLSDRGAVESMRDAIRGAMAASRSAFEGNGASAAAAAAAAAGAPPKRSGSRERGGGGRDNNGDGNNSDRRSGDNRRPASDRDRSDRGPPRGGGDRDRGDRDRGDRNRGGDRDRFGGRGGRGGGGGRGERGRDSNDGGDPAAAALRLSRGFRLDLQSTALGRAAAARLDSSSPVYAAVLHPTKTRLFDEQEAASPTLIPTLASAAARDAAAPAAAGASPMVFGGAVAFVARLGPDGRCSGDVAMGGASLPPSAGGKRGAGAAAAAAAAPRKESDDGWAGPEAGDPVLVATPDGRALAWGVYNGASMFRVRVLQTEAEALADEAGGGAGASSPSLVALDVPRLLERRVREAADLRRALGLSVGPPSAATPAATTKRRRSTTASKSADSGAGAATTTATTDVFRLVNGEGDRLSGLVADQMGPNVVVVQSNAAWVERHREDVERALKGALMMARAGAAAAPPSAASAPAAEEGAPAPRRRKTTAKAATAAEEPAVRVIWRRAERMLREEGVPLPPAAAVDDDDDDEDADNDQPPSSPPIVAREGGLLFAVAPERGQKTGFYADQRDNRAFVARLVAAGAAAAASGGATTPPVENDVLDVCCYSGGFALSAARAGATRVDAVDSSLAALELARENARLNGVGVFPPADDEEGGEEGDGDSADASSSPSSPPPVLALHRADASAFLSDANAQGKQWRVVVLDPPKLAPSRRDLERALRKYRHLNASALRAVRPGGFLITHSCSGAVARSPSLLQAIVCSAAAAAGRQVTLVREGGAAGDHPLHAAYPEGRYLTSLCFRVL